MTTKVSGKKVRYGKTAWWHLLHVRDQLQKYGLRVFPPIQPWDKRGMKAVRELIARGIFAKVSPGNVARKYGPETPKEGRLFFTADLQTVLEAIEQGTVRN